LEERKRRRRRKKRESGPPNGCKFPVLQRPDRKRAGKEVVREIPRL